MKPKAISLVFAIVFAIGIGLFLYTKRNTVIAEIPVQRETATVKTSASTVLTSGRIVLNGKPQGFDVPQGYSYLVDSVEDPVSARKIVNVDRDYGVIVFTHTPGERKNYVTEGDVNCVEYIAAPGNEGKSLIYIVYGINAEPPANWRGQILRRSSQD